MKLSIFLIAALFAVLAVHSAKADEIYMEGDGIYFDYHCQCYTSSPSPTASASSSPSPSPTESAVPSPSETPLVCPENYHIDASGKKCVQWELGGAPTPPPASITPEVLSASTSVLADTNSTDGMDNLMTHGVGSFGPTNLKIVKLNLDLAVSPSFVEGNDWEVFDDRVAWLSTSALPGQGNTILYTHERQGLFNNLYRLEIGDEISVYNDKWFTYKVTGIKVVSPSDLSSILVGGNRLTLFTCFGSFDQKRLVVYAE